MMKSLLAKNNLLVVVAAILYPIIFINGLSWLAWIFLAPLVVAIDGKKVKDTFKIGCFYGAVLSMSSFYWLPEIISKFAGQAALWPWLLTLAAIVIGTFYFGCILAVYAVLKKENYPLWARAILLASVWALTEYLFSIVFVGMPWLGFQIGNLLLSNLYFIQPAEWGGLYLLSFIVVFVNAWFGLILVRSKYIDLWKPIFFMGFYMGLCFLLFKNAAGLQDRNEKSISVAMMTENTDPEIKWDDSNGSEMVKRLLSLNQQASLRKKDIVLWTESPVPWTYRSDDAFIQEVFKTGQQTNSIQILGITTEFDSTAVYNSAYCLMPNGEVAGRYDKRFLLSFVEQPWSCFSLPFRSNNNKFHVQQGASVAPLTTAKGKIGVLICSEAFVAGSAIDAVRKGADFLVNISNDGWFVDIPFMKNYHFNSARLRAIEVRKDIAVNSNLGICGKISASGLVTDLSQSDTPLVTELVLNGNNYKSGFLGCPNLLLYILCLSITGFTVFRFSIKQ